MTDKDWLNLLNKTRDAAHRHRELLNKAEAEYERRYGNKPGDVDDDWWIDTFSYCMGDVDLEKIKQSAELHRKKNK